MTRFDSSLVDLSLANLSLEYRTGVSVKAAIALAVGLIVLTDRAHAEQSIVDALTGGKVDLYLRYRFEFVDDDQPRVIPGVSFHVNSLFTALG